MNADSIRDVAPDEWSTNRRWQVSHKIRGGTAVEWHGGVTARTYCGRNVRQSGLLPEPTGIDTINRCPKCLNRSGDEP